MAGRASSSCARTSSINYGPRYEEGLSSRPQKFVGCHEGGGEVRVRGGVSGRALRLSQKEIEDPAAADVGAGAAQVAKDVGVVAAGFLQGVGQHGESVDLKIASGLCALGVRCRGETEWSVLTRRDRRRRS